MKTIPVSIQQKFHPDLPHPIWRLGFRPFFLFSGVFGALAIAIWVGVYHMGIPQVGAFTSISWHAHEMIYGYLMAVVAGFILTASQNWSGLRGVHGAKLQWLVGVWLVGRVIFLIPGVPPILTTLVHLAFYPLLSLVLIPYFKPADMKMERVFFVFFALCMMGSALMHLDALGVIQGWGLRGAWVGLFTIIGMTVMIGGRVLPFFAESEKANAQPKVRTPIEIFAIGSTWLVAVTQVFWTIGTWVAVIAFLSSAAHALRLGGWYVKRVRRVSLLWVLYSAYLWLVVGFFLLGLSSLGWISHGSAIHALTLGSLGMMTVGMMARVCLGHTGRKLRPRPVVLWSFILILGAAIFRVFGTMILPQWNLFWTGMSGAMWVIALAIFVWVYAPILTAPRPDGGEG